MGHKQVGGVGVGVRWGVCVCVQERMQLNVCGASRQPPAPPVTRPSPGRPPSAQGCNGVDNGKLWFDHVRVPRAALLDAFSQVDRDGAFRRCGCGRLWCGVGAASSCACAGGGQRSAPPA